jgi:phage shock protein PspC (stress-responsive transcriptional regulator)
VTDRLYRHPTDRAIAGVAGGLAAWLGMDPSLVRVGWVLLAIFSGGLFVLVYIVMMIVVPLPPPGWVPRRRGTGPGSMPGQGAVPGWQPGGTTWAPPGPEGPGAAGWTGGPGAGDWTADPAATPGWGPSSSPPGWAAPPPEGGWAPDPGAAPPLGASRSPDGPVPGPAQPWTSGNAGLVFGVVLVGLGIWFLVDQYVRIDWDILWPVAIMVIGGALVAGAVLRNRSD